MLSSASHSVRSPNNEPFRTRGNAYLTATTLTSIPIYFIAKQGEYWSEDLETSRDGRGERGGGEVREGDNLSMWVLLGVNDRVQASRK